MSSKTSTAQLVVKTPQYIEEATEGVTPTLTPTFVSCGPVKSLSILIDGKWIDVSQIGPEDLIAIIQGLTDYQLKMKINLLASTFIKYAISSANYGTPAGTISKSLAIIWSSYFNGVENFITANGCRANTFSLVMDKGKAIECDIEFKCTKIQTPTATGPAGAVYATTPSGATWGHLDGGSANVSIGGVGILAQKVTININRNTAADYILGQPDPFSTQPHGRRVSGTIDVLWTNTTQEAALKTPTVANIAIVLKTTVSTITIANAPILTYKRDMDADATEAIAEGLGFRGPTISIT